MDKAKRILEEALNYKNCDGLIGENSRLEDAVLYAINQALRQPPVSGQSEQFICPCCGSDKTYKTDAIHCKRCAVTTEI